MAKKTTTNTILISTEILNKALRTLKPALGTANVMPAFRSYLFTNLEDQLTIVASSGDVYAAYHTGLPVIPKTFSVDAEKLQLSAQVAQGPEVSLGLEKEGNFLSAHFKAGKFNSTLVAYDGEDFPRFWSDKDVAAEIVAELTGEEFDSLMPLHSGCIAVDNLVHPALTNVRLTPDGTAIAIAATDTYKAVKSKAGVCHGQFATLLLTPTAIRILSQGTGPVTVCPGTGTVALKRDALTVYQRLVDLPFPDIDKMLAVVGAQPTTASFTVERAGLAQCIRTMAAFCGKDRHTIKIVVGKDDLTLSAESDEGHSAEQQIPSKNELKEPFTLYMNPFYMQAIVNSMPVQEISFDAKAKSIYIPDQNGIIGYLATQTKLTHG